MNLPDTEAKGMLVEGTSLGRAWGVKEDLALEEQRLWHGADQRESQKVHGGEAWQVLDLGQWETQDEFGQDRCG